MKRTTAKPTERRAKAGKESRASRKQTAPARATAAKSPRADSRSDPEVIAYLRALEHPLKAEIELVRGVILGVSPGIREGIKWNSPSFRTSDWFATLNLRARGGEERVWLILHMGAKLKGGAAQGRIADPGGLLEWLSKDRCLVTFKDAKDIEAKRPALQKIVREWIACLPK